MFLMNQSSITQRVAFSAVPYQRSSRAANVTVFLDLCFHYLNLNGICVIVAFWLPAHVTASSPHAPETNITPARLPIWTTNKPIEVQPGNKEDTPPHPFPDLLPIGSHCFCGRGWEGGGPHRVCVDSNWVRLPVTAHTSMAECF